MLIFFLCYDYEASTFNPMITFPRILTVVERKCLHLLGPCSSLHRLVINVLLNSSTEVLTFFLRHDMRYLHCIFTSVEVFSKLDTRLWLTEVPSSVDTVSSNHGGGLSPLRSDLWIES